MGVFSGLTRGVPAYTWVGLAYAVIAVAKFQQYSVTPLQWSNGAEMTVIQSLDYFLTKRLFDIPLFNGGSFSVSATTIFVALAFVTVWIEVVRATRIRDRGGNDWMSLVFTIVGFGLFVGFKPFGTLAFFALVMAAFGDVLLDRLVGQAVARRDFVTTGS